MAFSTNKVASTSLLRHPRGFVTINNQLVHWERFELSNTRYAAAGTFKVVVPVSALPKTLTLANLVNDAPLTVQINAGDVSQTNPNDATPSDLPMLILGDADEITYDPLRTSVTISGRDYISLFVDNKIKESFLSQTSSQIITQLATARGITPVVTETTTQVGSYFVNQFNLLTSQITEWDLMTFLAREEGFDIYIVGKTLYFEPKSDVTPYAVVLTVPYFTTPGSIPSSNVEEMALTRNLRLAKDIIVNVKSWNPTNKISYNKTATLRHTAGTTSAPAQLYNYVFANLTPDQAQAKADGLLKQISEHEMTINLRMPGDSLVTANSRISISGTNTLLDAIYYVKNVTREMDFDGYGYRMTIEAKTTPPYQVTNT